MLKFFVKVRIATDTWFSALMDLEEEVQLLLGAISQSEKEPISG